MILHNNIKYTIRGSAEDNGLYDHYYYTNSIEEVFNVIYEGKRGTLKRSYTVYIDEDTDQVIKRDFYNYVILCGYLKRANTCRSTAEELQLDQLLEEIKVEDDGDTSKVSNDFIDDADNNSSADFNDTGDPPSDIETDFGDGGTGKKGIFDDTTTNDKGEYNRSLLPLGADIKNPDVIGADPFDEVSPNPRETNLLNKGTTYPIIRINDHYFLDFEITYFSMETGMYKNYYDYLTYKMPLSGFLPTMKLIVTTSNPGLLKQNHVKQGDRCAVFFTSNHGMVKSMRCDFRITNVVTNQMDQNAPERYNILIITGELYVPDLRNEEIRYNFNGSSRDAMMDIAKRLRLSFFFCDPDDTNDVMVWCNCKTPEMFIHDLTTHAWKNPNSFFESWIDPRYGLSFLNINRLLGETGFDEPIDATLRINTFINNRAADGKAAEKSSTEKIKDTPQAKMLTNIPSDDESATVYHVNTWRLINNAQEIQDFVGLNCKQQFESVNPGLSDGNSSYSVDFSLCLNRTKFDPNKASDNNFYVLLGPARNKTYANADDMMGTSETGSSNKQEPELIVNQQSDGDAEQLLAAGNNMMSSGNTHKFYEVAYEHNMRNVLLLLKQIIQVELNGANLTIVRGEKLPMMLMDLGKVDSALRTSLAKTAVSELIYEAESGWFIIDGIEWIFDPNATGTGTNWRTKVNLTRREWPIPGKDNTLQKGNTQAAAELSKQIVMVDIGNNNIVKMAYKDALALYGSDKILGVGLDEVTVTGTAKNSTTLLDNPEEEGTVYNSDGSKETISAGNVSLDAQDQVVYNSDKVQGSNVPLTGLKDYMKDLYKTIALETDNKIKLVSARRWAVDELGNKVDGNAFIQKNGYYKCVNAMGEVMYFKQNNSRHLYGEAIDIINNGIDFTELMTTYIMKKPSILRLMYDNGLSAYIELAKDDMGTTTKHYHIGTDTIKQKEFWASVKAVNGTDIIPGTMITFSNYMKNNNIASVEITRNQIDELDNTNYA